MEAEQLKLVKECYQSAVGRFIHEMNLIDREHNTYAEVSISSAEGIRMGDNFQSFNRVVTVDWILLPEGEWAKG